MSKVVYEGWMVRYGRRKIGRSFIHMRYFVLESRLLAYYKKKPQDKQVQCFHSSVLCCLAISKFCFFFWHFVLLFFPIKSLDVLLEKS